MKQRNDPYYFLFAICIAIFVYFLFYNFAGTNVVALEAEPLQNQFEDGEAQGYSELVSQNDTRDTIRKIADSTMNGSKQIFLLKPKLRQPASLKPKSQCLTK